MKPLLSLAFILIISTPLFCQQTRLVPQEFTTIQSALNASQSGDIILVSPGLYSEIIIWKANKNGIELRSTDGPENTIIDASFGSRPIHIQGDLIIDNTTIIDGFTLKNGSVNTNNANGGGIYIDQASPILRNLIIENNKIISGHGLGGGMSFNESSSIVENCIVRNNSITSDSWTNGGGIYVTESNVDFYNCVIKDNNSESGSWSYGGGIYIDISDVRMVNCTIEGNTTNGGGWSYGAGIKIYGNISGGMIFDVDLIGCTITNNRPLGDRKYGSGVYATYPVNLNIINSILHGNGPSNSTVYLDIETTNIIHSTISNNQAGLTVRGTDLNIANSILWNNGFSIKDQSNIEESNISVDHSIIEGGYFGPGNIDINPILYDAQEVIPHANSPALNAGNRNIIVSTDILGNERPFPRGSAPDIGAYEIKQDFAHVLSRFFFDEDADGVQDSDEVLLGRGAIQIDGEKVKENTSPNGMFTLVKNGLTKINYYNINTGSWLLSSPIDEYTFDVMEKDFADTIYFGIYPSREAKQLVPGIYSPALRCSRIITMDFFVKNEGTTRENGVLWAQLDPLASEIMPLITPDIIEDGKYGWNFYNLLPGESFTRQMAFKVPGIGEIEQGQLIKFAAEATVASDPDCIATFSLEDEVRCSYDPNDKLVNPDRLDQLILRDQDVTYTIRFQNVGNDYADDVVLVDTLDSNFDLSTFKLLKTSHPDQLRYTLSSNGILNFNFQQIYLPDSTTDEQGSNGYIMYSIRPDSTLNNYIKVENTAYIYFDFNPAIVTNTTLNSVVDMFPIVSTSEEEELKFNIYPNPSSGQINLPMVFDHIDVLNENGKYVKSITNTRSFDFSEALEGIYFIRAIKNNHAHLAKFVLIKD